MKKIAIEILSRIIRFKWDKWTLKESDKFRIEQAKRRFEASQEYQILKEKYRNVTL